VVIRASCHAPKFGNGGYERSPLSQTFHTAKPLAITGATQQTTIFQINLDLVVRLGNFVLSKKV
jgi:hypothetical protein